MEFLRQQATTLQEVLGSNISVLQVITVRPRFPSPSHVQLRNTATSMETLKQTTARIASLVSIVLWDPPSQCNVKQDLHVLPQPTQQQFLHVQQALTLVARLPKVLVIADLARLGTIVLLASLSLFHALQVLIEQLQVPLS